MSKKSKLKQDLNRIIDEINKIYNDDDYCDYRNRYDDYDRTNSPQEDEMGDLWEEKYEDIFSLAKVAYKLMDEIGIHFEYDNPDTTYQEDSAALVNALNDIKI